MIIWQSKKQNVVVRSSVGVEYRVMASRVCEMLWLKRIFEELHMSVNMPMKLNCDNKVAISITQNTVQMRRLIVELFACLLFVILNK